MFKIENNSGKIGGAEFVITPLDENILIGTTAQNYVKGDTWSISCGLDACTFAPAIAINDNAIARIVPSKIFFTLNIFINFPF